MITGTVHWKQGSESFGEYLVRKNRIEAEASIKRRQKELFRMSLSQVKFDRYAFGVEHGVDEEMGVPDVHAYVACIDCYGKFPGVVDPRTVVADSGIKDELDPKSQVLAVGVNMLTAIKSMIAHEKEHHGGPR